MTADPALSERPDVTAAISVVAAWIENQRAYSGLPGVSIGLVHDQSLSPVHVPPIAVRRAV